MPKFGRELISVSHGGKYTMPETENINCSHWYDIHVNAHGNFYVSISDELVEAASTLHGERSSRHPYKMQVFDTTLAGLRKKITEIHDAYLSPTVKVRNVIQYTIDSKVAFAETGDGEIVPNCYYGEDAKWPQEDEMFGKLDVAHGAYGGYSLAIGARARIRTTKQYGNGSVRVSYEPYYGEGNDHFNREHPAARLNSWTSFRLGHNPKQIPYTDEAAVFFFDMMEGMAKMAKLIQHHTFDRDSLVKLIDSKQKLLEARS